MTPSLEQATTSPEKDPLYIEAVARALRVLEAFSDSPEPQTLSQLAKAAGIDKSAAQRMAHTLGKLGYLEQSSGGLVPGRRLLERSFDYLRTNPIVSRAIPILTELRRNVQERVDLSLFDDLSMLYLIRLQSKRDTFFAHLIGRRVPTFCTSGGRAVLAGLPEEQVLDILTRSDRRKITPRTTTEIDEILVHIATVHDHGYSLAIEQLQIGELAVAVAITDKQGLPIGAIHVAGSLSEWEPENFEKRIAPLVVAAARDINSSGINI